jgi:hypothetical protein
VKTVIHPTGKKQVDFHNAKAMARKDLERAFGILQAQFAIVIRFWDQDYVWYIMNVCVIIHNMIIENECGQDVDNTFFDFMGQPVRPKKIAEKMALVSCYLPCHS